MKRKNKNRLIWTIAGFIALAYLAVGIPMVVAAPRQVMYIDLWGLPAWSIYPIGIVELALAGTILIPRYRRLAVYGIFIWTAVAEVTLLLADPPQYSSIVGPLIYAIPAAAIWFMLPKVRKNNEADNEE